MLGDNLHLKKQAEYILYGRRRGRNIRANRVRLLNDYLPKARVPRLENGALNGVEFAGRRSVFKDLWLEIGFGQGEHLLAQALKYPEVLFIGCEPFVDGVANLLSQIQKTSVNNIMIHDDDARDILDVLPEASVGRIFILFPDPWPKRRHHRRRFITPENLEKFSNVLADGAQLHFATDHSEYGRWALARFINHGELEWIAESPMDWTSQPPGWFHTRYEVKAQKNQRPCIYFNFKRCSRLQGC